MRRVATIIAAVALMGATSWGWLTGVLMSVSKADIYEPVGLEETVYVAVHQRACQTDAGAGVDATGRCWTTQARFNVEQGPGNTGFDDIEKETSDPTNPYAVPQTEALVFQLVLPSFAQKYGFRYHCDGGGSGLCAPDGGVIP